MPEDVERRGVVEREVLDRDGDYRSAEARVRVRRHPVALPPLPDELSPMSKGVGRATAVLAVTAMIGVFINYIAPGHLVAAPLVLIGGLGFMASGVGFLMARRSDRWRRNNRMYARELERLHQAVDVVADPTGITASPRVDEPDWDGRVSAEKIRRLYVEPCPEGRHQVRVELEDGEQRTLLEGIVEAEEADWACKELERALQR